MEELRRTPLLAVLQAIALAVHLENMHVVGARFIPRLKASDIADLRIEIMANNEIVMKEMERRGPPEG